MRPGRMRNATLMSALPGYTRLLVAAAMLLTLAACNTTDTAALEEPTAAPITGQTTIRRPVSRMSWPAAKRTSS